MKRGLTALLVSSLLLSGCGMVEESVKTVENVEVGAYQANSKYTHENEYHGFFDVSYENQAGEDVEMFEDIEAFQNGQDEDIYLEIQKGIKKCLPGQAQDAYQKIFAGKSDEKIQCYIVIENKRIDGQYYFDMAIVEEDRESKEFSLKKSVRIGGSINEAKTAVFFHENKIMVSTEAPGSSYIENYYMENRGAKLEYIERRSMDITADFLEKKISLLQSGKLNEALELEGACLYPYTYRDLISKYGNLLEKTGESERADGIENEIEMLN